MSRRWHGSRRPPAAMERLFLAVPLTLDARREVESGLEPIARVLWLGARSFNLAVRMPVNEVVLFRSHLGGGPPRYEALARFPLAMETG
ncbi:MAG: hypothetical protein M3434_02345 [Gemmatimonadota bacterium]|nr:hypothetical protein [Gemmatimonadota bacterium]